MEAQDLELIKSDQSLYDLPHVEKVFELVQLQNKIHKSIQDIDWGADQFGKYLKEHFIKLSNSSTSALLSQWSDWNAFSDSIQSNNIDHVVSFMASIGYMIELNSKGDQE
jgi:hypothetical protein